MISFPEGDTASVLFQVGAAPYSPVVGRLRGARRRPHAPAGTALSLSGRQA